MCRTLSKPILARQKSGDLTPVAAIVRPTRQGNHLDSVRADLAKDAAVPAPHVRTNKLEDYVKWLREDAASKRTVNPAASLTSDVVLPTASEEIPNFDKYLPKPSRGFSVDQIQRIDGAHHFVAPPVTPVSQFPLDPEGQKPEARSLSGEVIMPDTSKTKLEATALPAGQTIGAPPTSARQVNTDEIIRTVAQAIASVLTDQSEPEIQQKIRQQIAKTTHEAALAALPTEDAEAIAADIAAFDEAEQPQESNRTETPSPHFQKPVVAEEVVSGEAIGQSNQEIPTTIAAWDVEDFRWPAVTNQMIVAGSEAISELASSVFKLLDTTARRLAVTSPGRGEGTTSVAISLARWAAASGKKVLLVDADLASPGLSGQVGLGPNISWVNAVANSLDTNEVIIRSQKTPVCVMPMTPIVTRVTWPRFIFDSLGALTAKVESSFDLIIFDVGPTSQLLAELSRSSLMIDASLIVHNGTGISDFQKTARLLQEFGVSKYLVAQNSVRQPGADVHPNVA